MITLSIVGIIATFTIPKVVSATSGEHKRAVFKESCMAVYSTMRTHYDRGAFVAVNATDLALFTDNINRTNATTTQVGCGYPATGMPWADWSTCMKLNNGAAIHLQFYNSHTKFIWIDWDGPSGNNQDGDDVLRLVVNTSQRDVDFFGTIIRPGHWASQNPSATLYNWIYQ